MDKRTERFIINRFIDMSKLLASLNIDVAANNTMFCPFHDNTRTKAAHFYPDDENGPCIFCYAEHRLYTNYDVYKILIPEVNTSELAQAIYARLTKDQKDFIESNINSERELPELPYIDGLRKFKKREISYLDLLKEINLKLTRDESSLVLENIYNLPSVKLPDNGNKYVYFMNHYDSQYKVISSLQVLRDVGDLPEFLIKYLRNNGDCIILPNIINNVVYSLTFRTLGERKQFLKYGDVSHLLYNLGNLPDDFVYGIPLVLVEGNIDCDSMKQIYPYTVASLTSDLSTNQLQLLSHLTDKVIVAYDNDESGISGYYRTRAKLNKLGVSTSKFNHYNKLHDLGDLIDLEQRDKQEFDYVLRSYRNQIDSLL